MSGNWFVFDPDPVEGFAPLTGPFETYEVAFEWANLAHDEDGIGNCVILQAVAP
jgi:hypothetical protein